MAIQKVVVVDGNNLIVRIDRGVAGRGVTDVEPVEISGSLYLVFTFSDGTTETVGPVGTIQYIGQAPVVVSGSTISLSTVPVNLGGTGQITANAGFNALAPTQTGNSGKYLKTDGTNSAWDLLDISTADITGVLPIANGGTNASTISAARTNLGLGTIATQDASAIAITGGTITGITDLAVADGGTGSSTAAGAMVNLLPSYTGNANKRLGLDGTATGLEWVTDGGGTVTSVDVSGGTTGLSFTGGPVTTSGTITLSGTLDLDNGGTGATTAAGARTNLNAVDQALTLTAGTGLSGGGDLTANRSFSITNTGVTAAAYGAASKTLTATVNAQGQLTVLADTPIAITNTQISGLGTMSTQNSNSVAITGGSITGITDLAVADGGTGASDAAGARTNLNAANQATTITAGTGLTGGGDLSANRTIDIANTTVTAGAFGSASNTLTATVNAQGQLTALAATPIAIANTQVSGLGTMSTQNSNAVTITGGSITGITDLAIADGGTGASNAPDARSNLGLGTAAVLNAGVALGVATLDAGGTVPLSQIPASIQGGVSYQGAWNASTNTPTLTSSVGTKGHYYVVSVAGNTNLNGVTDWLVGDWAIYNGTAWEKIDNTDQVASVNGYTGVVVLSNTDVGAPPTSLTISAGTGLSGGGDLTTNRTLSIANTAVSAGSYGTASAVPSFTVNGQGQLTAASDVTIAITNTQVSGLGTMSTQNANSVAITGGSITGITDLAIADGGTGASNAPDARTNLGLGTIATQNASSVTITGGTINGTSIGATTASTGEFTSLTVNDNATFGSSNTDTATFTARVSSEFTPSSDNTYDLGRTGHEWRNLYLTGTGNIDSLIADTADINGGTIDSTAIGSTTPSSGAFTTVTASTAIGIASGGTGQTTANAAFNALAPSQTGNSGKYLTTDGTDTSWASNPLGTVTSVAASVPSFLSIAGSPITTSGTLAISLSGTALPTTSGGTGLTSFTSGGVVYASSTSALATGSALTFDGTTLATSAATGYKIELATNATTPRIDFIDNSVYTGNIRSSGGVFTIQNSSNNPIVFATNSTEGMRLTSTGLGIGTSSPTNKLTIGGTDSSVFFKNAGATTGYAATQIVNTGGSFYMGVTSSTGAFWQNTSGNYAATIGTSNATNLTFATNDNIRATLDSAGNLGIGTSSPVVKLQVGDTSDVGLALSNSSSVTSGNRGTIYAYNSNTSTVGYIRFGADTDNVGTNIQFGTRPVGGSVTGSMTLSSAGNLGLGVTPSAWWSGLKALQFGTAGSLFSNSDRANLASNMYVDSATAGRYINNGYALRYAQEVGTHAWSIAASGTAGDLISFTQAMTLDASGNLGVGTTSPINNSGYGGFSLNGTSGALLSMMTGGTESSRIASLGDLTSIQCKASTGYITFVQGVSGGTERARIDSSGNLLVGITSLSGNEKLRVYQTSGEAVNFSNADLDYSTIVTKSQTASASTHYVLGVLNSAGSVVGRITHNDTSTTYATSSDYRLKENIAPMTGALATVAQLKPCTYTWKSNGLTGQGFIAHELKAVVSDAVVGEKDAVDANGNPEYQGVDKSFLVATLTAAIQEQQAIIESLKARLDAANL